MATEEVSKTDAVKKAVEEGWTKPSEGVMYVKTMFGLDLSPSHFSNIKSTLGQAKKRRGRPPGSKSKPKAEPVATPAPRAAARSNDGIDIEAVQQVKELAQRVGAENLHALIELFSQ